MKESTMYFIGFIIDVMLIILWPIMVFSYVYTSPIIIFIIGALWCDDIYSAIRNWKKYKFYK